MMEHDACARTPYGHPMHAPHACAHACATTDGHHAMMPAGWDLLVTAIPRDPRQAEQLSSAAHARMGVPCMTVHC
jgi:hypothetical protein